MSNCRPWMQVTISMSTELPVVVRYHIADLGKLRCAQGSMHAHLQTPASADNAE